MTLTETKCMNQLLNLAQGRSNILTTFKGMRREFAVWQKWADEYIIELKQREDIRGSNLYDITIIDHRRNEAG